MAKFTIPSLLPSVSAPKITASNNAYTNPQAVIDKSYEIFNKGMQEAVKNGVIAMNNNAAHRKAEFDAQAQLTKEQSDFRRTELAKVEGMANVGNAKFDQNKQNYMYALKDRYVEVKNAMDKHPELQQEGAKELAQINNQIKEFQSAAPLMVTAIKTLKEKLKLEPNTAGAISSKNSDGIQRILLGLEGGDADISIVTGKDGNLVLFMDTQTYTDASGNEVVVESPIEFNVSAFTQMSADGGELFETVPDIKPELEQIVKEGITLDGGEDINPIYYEVIKGPDVGMKGTEIKQWRVDMGESIPQFINYNGKQIINPYYDAENPDTPLNGKVAAQMELIQNGSLVSLVDSKDMDDQDMSIIYQDIMEKGMGKGLDQFTWGEVPEEGSKYTAEQVKDYQRNEALKYLANTAVHDYGLKERVTLVDKETVIVDETVTTAESDFGKINTALSSQEGASSYFKDKTLGTNTILSVELDAPVGPFKEGEEPDPTSVTFNVAMGQKQESRTFDLTDPSRVETLIGLLVKGRHGSSEDAKKIRALIQNMFKNKKNKKKDNNETDFDKFKE